MIFFSSNATFSHNRQIVAALSGHVIWQAALCRLRDLRLTKFFLTLVPYELIWREGKADVSSVKPNHNVYAVSFYGGLGFLSTNSKTLLMGK